LSHIEILRPADIELREAVGYYRERDPRVAERFLSEVRRTLELLESFPNIGGPVPDVDDSDVRRVPVHKFPYSIVFLRLPDRLQVIAIAHKRKRPAYFVSRLQRS
jgi:plasmid stabilization system protein ParE